MNVTLIDNGKQPKEPLNINLCLPLPADTPYGNLQLKFLWIVNRLDEANLRIIESFDLWEKVRSGDSNAIERHIFTNEAIIYLVRRTCDEIISLIWFLDYCKKNNGKYPQKIDCDKIGAVVSDKTNYKLMDPFNKHLEILRLMNEIANAFKHSFLNSDFIVVGGEEPCVSALALDYNNLKSPPKFYNVDIKTIILKFNEFYNDSIMWLRQNITV